MPLGGRLRRNQSAAAEAFLCTRIRFSAKGKCRKNERCRKKYCKLEFQKGSQNVSSKGSTDIAA